MRSTRRSAWPAMDRDRIVAFSKRSQQVLLLAGATGAVTGLAVAGFDKLTVRLLHGVLALPVAAQALMPAVGLFFAAIFLRYGGAGASPATSDVYIRAFHDRGRRMEQRPVLARVAAAIATLGSGAPLGYEGPSLYLGAAIGTRIQRRFGRLFSPEDAKVLLVAGAAAGVAAIFKAPVTGMVFALEVPYQRDIAHRMLLPAAISAAASYVVFAALAGTDPLLPIAGQPPFNLVDLGGAAAVGLAAGLLARAFAAVMKMAKKLSTTGHPAVRIAGAGAVLASTVLGGHLIAHAPLSLGPGYNALRWALAPERSVFAIVALGTLRVAGTAAAVSGGGSGGLFIPLVIQGALIGRVVGGLFDSGNGSLFPVVGMAAFLGAGYHVPLAAVVFVAEFTGRPGFVVPGLIAAVVAQLVIGRASVSPYQVGGRVGHLEGRLQLPLATLVNTDARTVPPDATVEEFFWQHLVGTRQQSVAVVESSTFLGLAGTGELAGVDRDDWAATTVGSIMRSDVPVASTSWLLADAIRTMEDADVQLLAVCDGPTFVGTISAGDIVNVGEILDRLAPEDE